MIEAPAAPTCARGIGQADRYPLWSLFDMLQNYLPFYEIAGDIQRILRIAGLYKGGAARKLTGDTEAQEFKNLVERIEQTCDEHGLSHTAELAWRAAQREVTTYDDVYHGLTHLNDSLTDELEREAIFRIPPERKNYYDKDSLFGPEVASAFPSCARDIRRAGTCYALEQEDGCVHHLMLVLERGLNALAGKVSVLYERANWQPIISEIQKKVRAMPGSLEKDFYLEVNAQFGFLKDAYRNHAEHARDDHYDMPRALSILTHVRDFMQALAKGGLTE